MALNRVSAMLSFALLSRYILQQLNACDILDDRLKQRQQCYITDMSSSRILGFFLIFK